MGVLEIIIMVAAVLFVGFLALRLVRWLQRVLPK